MIEKSEKSDDEVLAEAQRRLEEHRRELHDDEAAVADEKRRAGARIADPKPFAPPPQLGPVEPRLRKRRDEQLVPVTRRALERGLPGLLYVVPPPDDTEEEFERRIRATIPPKFRPVRWANIAKLVREKDRGASLGAVSTDDGRELQGDAAAWWIWEQVKHATKVVFLGETGAGKTLAAAALCAGELQRHPFVRWLHADALKEPGAIDSALRARTFILDDLGRELKNASANSGWIPNYAAPACDLFARLYDQDAADRRLVVTTDLDDVPMGKLYGGGLARRVYEDAVVIKLSRIPA